MAINGNNNSKLSDQSHKEDGIFVIGSHFSVKGNIAGEGVFILFGKVDGNIHADTVVIHQQGVATGDIVCKQIDVTGTVLGTIQSHDVVARAGACIEGRVSYSTISMEAGAVILGQLEQSATLASERSAPIQAVSVQELLIEFPTEIQALLAASSTLDKMALKTKSGELAPAWITLSSDGRGLLLDRQTCAEKVKRNEKISSILLQHNDNEFEINLPDFSVILGMA